MVISTRVNIPVIINSLVPIPTIFEWFAVINCPAYGALTGGSGIGTVGGDNSGNFYIGGPNSGVNDVLWYSFNSVYGSVSSIPGYLNELKPYGTRTDISIEMPIATQAGTVYRGCLSLAQYVDSSSSNSISFQMLAMLGSPVPSEQKEQYSSRASM